MKKIIFYNILIFFILIFSFEITLRLFFNITPQGVSKDIIDENSSKPRFHKPNLKKGKAFGKNVYTDENGFRISKKWELKKSDKNNKENVYFVGGSVTFGNGVDQSETFSGILNTRFKNINVHNASMIGSNIENNFYIIKNKIDNQNLKKIYINFSLDDISSSENILPILNGENTEKSSKDNFLKRLREIPFLYKINVFVRSKSVIYTWIKGFIFNAELRYYTYEYEMFKKQKNLDYLEQNMDMLKAYNNEISNKITFLIIPYSYQIKGKNCQSEDLAEKIIERELIERKFKFFKIKDLFCKIDKRNKIFLNQDPSHLSKFGHKILADFLENDLK